MNNKKEPGKLIFFYGPMFSGKTNNLIETIEHSTNEKLIFKPMIDTRSKNIRSRTGKKIETIIISDPSEIIENLLFGTQEIFIDEVHFFDLSLIDVLNDILERSIDVYASGLDLDYKQEMFEISEELIKIADFPVRLFARCHICFKPSAYSVRTTNNKIVIDKSVPQILIDDDSRNLYDVELNRAERLYKEKSSANKINMFRI